jgi:hypothetical protein
LRRFFARDDATGGAHQGFQQIELDGSQRQRLAVARDNARRFIEVNVADHPSFGGRRIGVDARAPQNGANPGDQFARVERLWQIIVSAHLQTDDAVDVVAARRQHQDRRLRAPAYLAQDFKAVHVRQHDVEDDQGIRAGQSAIDAGLAVMHHLEFKAFAAQILRQQLTQIKIIIDNQYAIHPASSDSLRFLRANPAVIHIAKHIIRQPPRV